MKAIDITGAREAPMSEVPVLALPWVEPVGWLSLSEARRRAVAQLEVPMSLAVIDAWQDELPQTAHPAVRRQVKRGLRAMVENLTAPPKSERFQVLLHPMMNATIAHYWEPPTTSLPTALPEFQLRAYRWVAVWLAHSVRGHLERLHVEYTSDAVMPQMNTELRRLAYEMLLTEPVIAWRLSFAQRCILEFIAHGHAFDVPPAVG